MGRARNWMAAALLIGLLATMAGEAAPHRQPSGAPPEPAAQLPPLVLSQLADAAVSQEAVELDLMLPSPAELAEVKAIVKGGGGEVLLAEERYAQVRIPPALAAELPRKIPGVAVGVNARVAAARSNLIIDEVPLAAADAANLMALNLEPSGIPDFRSRYGVGGYGVTVAVIDSGIDPGHPDLQTNPLGQRKVVDWKDFTTEGSVSTAPVEWAANLAAPDGRTYALPTRPDGLLEARFGYWDESLVTGVINRDLDRNGRPFDRFGVLLVRRQGAGDQVYVDTNNNGDLRDEQPLGLFRTTGEYRRLGPFRQGEAAQRQLAFVLADVDGQTGRVSFGFDSLGHGTQVAGTLGASSGAGLSGVAPGVQLLALKVINSRDDGNWFAIRQAIQYAAQNGASIINLSLGGLPLASAYDTAASAWLDEIARQYGVLIILASDNTGPGLSSGATIGNPSEMMAVGAYYSPEMWQRDYGFFVPTEGVWWGTGMGPRADGSFLPNLIAPGGAPTTSPRWLHATGYTTAVGTSIAAPHVSGAAALLIEAGRKQGLPHDRLSLRRALEFGARRITGFASFEQGNGLLTLEASLQELRKINSVPALAGKTLEGNGGLLARSYQPGNGSLVIANLADSLTRVNVYSSESWVRPALRSITLPAGSSRELPLSLAPPTQPGVHSAFLNLNHQDKYGPSLILPITYIRPVTLAGPDRSYMTADWLPVTRFRRYFIEVAAGTTQLSVSAQSLFGAGGTAEGTFLLQVFRPDGVQAFRSAEVGVNGSGLSTLFTTQQPLEGVWEVVVTALPDTAAGTLQAGYRLEVAAPYSGVPSPLRFSVPAGSTTVHDLRLVNPFPEFVAKLETAGLSAEESSLPWRVVRQLNQVDDFILTRTAAYFRLEIANALPAGASLNLDVWRYDNTAHEWRSFWSSATPGTSNEVVDLKNVPPGRYQVYVTHDEQAGPVPADLQYQYRRIVTTQGYNLSITGEPYRWERGIAWTPKLTIYAPVAPGRYHGQVLLIDAETGQTRFWYPIEVSVGQPSLTVEPMVSRLQTGQPGKVTLEVRDAASRDLLDAPVVVNGRRYLTVNGQVTVPVEPAVRSLSLRVEVDRPDYQPFQSVIQVPVHDEWNAYPTGVEPTPEPSQWRLKVEELLQ